MTQYGIFRVKLESRIKRSLVQHYKVFKTFAWRDSSRQGVSDKSLSVLDHAMWANNSCCIHLPFPDLKAHQTLTEEI